MPRAYPDVALIPILSDTRGIQLVVKKWMRKGRLPDAIVIEHPRYAGGHLGAAKIEDLTDPRFDFERVLPEVLAFFHAEGIDPATVPLIPAGGINTHERIRDLIARGAAAVQIGTAFAVTVEGDADIEFKRVLAGARPEDIVEFTSVAGLPARAVRTPWLASYLKYLPKLAAVAHKKPRCTLKFDCLIQCGLRDGIAKIGQFCIDMQLAAALARRRREGALLPWRVGAAVRQRNPAGARAHCLSGHGRAPGSGRGGFVAPAMGSRRALALTLTRV